MSREIKFRAWIEAVLPEETGLYYPTVMQLIADGSVDKLWTNDYKFTADTSKFTLMQYTGLKDKNGIEIYEGDIVHTDYFKDNGWNTKVFTGNEPIVFEAGCFRMGDYSTLDECTSNSEYKLEVIGNIYENPEETIP